MNRPLPASNTPLILGLVAVGVLVFFGIAAAMGVAVFAKRRQVLANEDAGLLHIDAATPSSAVRTEIFVINTNDVFLYDSKETNAEATRLAVKRDAVGFARVTREHGTPIAKGERVRITEGALHVRVAAVEGGASGWTDRDFLSPER